MKNMRKIFLTIVTIFIFSGMSFATDATDLKIIINGEVLQFEDAKPYVNENDRTMIPVRKVAETFGADVGWDGETQTVKLTSENNTILLTIGDNVIDINGNKETMDTKAIVTNDRTFVPLSFVANAFGAEVGWDGETNTVSISITKAEDEKFDITVDPEVDYNVLNCANLCIVNTDGQYLYFANQADEMKLYRCDLKGNNIEKISDIRSIIDIQLTDNYIILNYYDYDKKCQNIGRVDKEKHEFFSYNINPYRLSVVKNKIYYADNSGINDEVFSMNIDGTDKISLFKECDDMVVSKEQTIYMIEDGNIYSSKSKKTLKKGSKLRALHVFNNDIYYTYRSSNKITKIDSKGKSEQSYKTKNTVEQYTVVDKSIFYTDISTGLYKYDIESGKEIKIVEGAILSPCVIGNYLFYQIGYDATLIYVYDIKSEKITELK